MEREIEEGTCETISFKQFCEELFGVILTPEQVEMINKINNYDA